MRRLNTCQNLPKIKSRDYFLKILPQLRGRSEGELFWRRGRARGPKIKFLLGRPCCYIREGEKRRRGTKREGGGEVEWKVEGGRERAEERKKERRVPFREYLGARGSKNFYKVVRPRTVAPQVLGEFAGVRWRVR
jgi:hypothetical protein